jgi:plasmid stabilization system protein ParE
VARLIWTPESRWWLREIYTYISRDRPGAAYKVVHGIFEKAHLPLAFPDVGYQYQPEKYPGVRILLYGRYRIVYQRRADESIYVLGVFHEALDLKRHLRLTGHEAAEQGDGRVGDRRGTP